MSFKHIDADAALRRVANRRIEDAMLEGKFDNLPGAGMPLDLEPMPAEESARMLWWSVRLLRQNGLSDYAARMSKSADTLR